MTRYLKQADGSYICGPIAVMNVLKWVGYDVKYNDLKYFKDMCECNIDGTRRNNFERTLGFFRPDIKFYVRNIIKIGQIDKHLEKDGFIILQTSKMEDGNRTGHYWSVSSKSMNSYIAHNVRDYDENFYSRCILLRSEVVQRLRRSLTYYNEPRGYFISKGK